MEDNVDYWARINGSWVAVRDSRSWEQLYADGVALALQQPGLSCVTLQRKMGLGYTKARKLLLALIQSGFVDYSEDEDQGI